jgi:hypothetical protein
LLCCFPVNKLAWLWVWSWHGGIHIPGRDLTS